MAVDLHVCELRGVSFNCTRLSACIFTTEIAELEQDIYYAYSWLVPEIYNAVTGNVTGFFFFFLTKILKALCRLGPPHVPESCDLKNK